MRGEWVPGASRRWPQGKVLALGLSPHPHSQQSEEEGGKRKKAAPGRGGDSEPSSEGDSGTSSSSSGSEMSSESEEEPTWRKKPVSAGLEHPMAEGSPWMSGCLYPHLRPSLLAHQQQKGPCSQGDVPAGPGGL